MDGERFSDVWQLSPMSPELRRMATWVVPVAQPAAGAQAVYTVKNDYWERVVAVTATITTSAVTTLRQLFVAIANADGTKLAQVPLSVQLPGSATWAAFGAIDHPGTTAQPGATLANTGTQTSPGAGTVIATLTPGAGLFTFGWQVQLTGTPAAADANNFGLFLAAVQQEVSINQGAVGGPFSQLPSGLVVPAATAVTVKAIGAGTAGAIYAAQLVATPAAGGFTTAKLPQLILKPGWQLQIGAVNLDAADQLSAITVTTERYPSQWADGKMRLERDDLLRDIAAEIGHAG